MYICIEDHDDDHVGHKLINYIKASIALAKMVHALSTVLDELAPIPLIYSTNIAAETADHI